MKISLEKVPDTPPALAHLPVWPEFRQDSSTPDGLIPACRVESWEAFIEAMGHPSQNRASRQWVYRGQRGGDWPLASTLGRKFDGGSIPNDKREGLLREFELAMRGRGYDLSGYVSDDAEIEKWAIGQHHGLLTPLLDWTRSPFIALFFAFNTSDDTATNPSRAIFCLNMSALQGAFGDDVTPLFREPMGHNNSRLVNQAGLFTMTPEGEDNLASFIINRLIDEEIVNEEPVTTPVASKDGSTAEGFIDYEVTDNLAAQLQTFIRKVHVPNVGRTACLDMLRKMNIHNGTLFPDAQGASLFCNDWLERLMDEEKRDTAERQRRAAEASPVVMPRELAESAMDDVAVVQAVLDQALANEFSEEERAGFAEKLYNRFDVDRSIDWVSSTSKVAKVKTGQRRLMAALEFPEKLREPILEQLVELYLARSSGGTP